MTPEEVAGGLGSRLIRELNESAAHLQLPDFSDVGKPDWPLVLRVGNSRTGSTLFMQGIASLTQFSFPTNFLSLFYSFPVVGARVWELLTNPEKSNRKEFIDVVERLNFDSWFGKTEGMSGPHEFWKFWERFFDYHDVPISQVEWAETAQFDSFNLTVNALLNEFGKPFVMKGHHLNHYLQVFSGNVPTAVFVHGRRNLIDTIASHILAVEKRWGPGAIDFGWKSPNWQEIQGMDQLHRIAGQVYFNEKAILDQRHSLGSRYIEYWYEDLCHSPEKTFAEVVKLAESWSGKSLHATYNGPKKFNVRQNDDRDLRKLISQALTYWSERFGPLDSATRT